MLENVLRRETVKGFARRQARPVQFETIKPSELETWMVKGWDLKRRNKNSVRIYKAKSVSALLEGRVWSLMYKMGFAQLSGEGGATLDMNPADVESSESQLDVVAVDDEVGIIVECKSAETPKQIPTLDEKIAKLSIKREPFGSALKKSDPDRKRHIGLVLAVSNVILSDVDRKKLEEQKVTLLEERDLDYYERLVTHLGEAARYQFLAEVFRGRPISGLEIKVPALRSKMGKSRCYTFSVRPDYLLKIAYVSRRAKGKPSDVDTYQRMVRKKRLKTIQEYISNNGAFPTNVVLNIEKSKYIRFDVGASEGDPEGARFGWLYLSPTYGSAWVIDGQHRLLAYSGHPLAPKSVLSVLAFDGLSPSEQARFFIDINHEQKSVSQNLLDELWAELQWDSEDPEQRVRAVASKAVQDVNADRQSPFYERVLLADTRKTETRCVSLTSIVDALTKPGLYLSRLKNSTAYGPLYAETNEQMLRRTRKVLVGFFSEISAHARDWWEFGAAPGGGLAMNDGVTICLSVMRSIFDHLGKRHKLGDLTDQELIDIASPYTSALAKYLASLPHEERKSFRGLRGVQGQTTGTRTCQQAIHLIFQEFLPEGLTPWMERQKSGANEEGHRLIGSIETILQEHIINALKREFPSAEEWWYKGVPQPVRIRVDNRLNETNGEAGGREQNFELLDYRKIITEHYLLFGYLGYGEGGKDKRTLWINDVNSMRRSVMHPSRREILSRDQLDNLRTLEDWLRNVPLPPHP